MHRTGRLQNDGGSGALQSALLLLAVCIVDRNEQKTPRNYISSATSEFSTRNVIFWGGFGDRFWKVRWIAEVNPSFRLGIIPFAVREIGDSRHNGVTIEGPSIGLCCDGPTGFRGSLNSAPIMPKDGSLSESYEPNRCCFSGKGTRDMICFTGRCKGLINDDELLYSKAPINYHEFLPDSKADQQTER